MSRANQFAVSMTLDRLHTFRVVSTTLHFRHAAEELGVTESAVSQQIGSLEKEVGVPLFERIGRREGTREWAEVRWGAKKDEVMPSPEPSAT